MRILVLGGSGGTGRAVIEQAIARGHDVTALVRSPVKLAGPRPGLTVCTGDPRDVDASVVDGHDAVISALGPRGLGKDTILSDGARATVAAMQATGIRRLLVVSAAVLFRGEGVLPWLLRSTLLRNVATDSAAMEDIVARSGLDWTIARPPRLTHGMLTRQYDVDVGRLPRGARLVMHRADVAHFLLDELELGKHIHHVVGMAARKR